MARFLFLCFLYSLPGPLKIVLDADTFQWYTVNRRICPVFDPKRDTTFHLYTKDNISNDQVLMTGNDSALAASTFNYSNPTVIFFHDFMESYKSSDATKMKIYNLLLRVPRPPNVILVDSQRLMAGPDFFTAATNVRPIGNYSAKFVDYLVQRGLTLSNLQIIGMGLGAHIAGVVGRSVKGGKVARITGLDPTGPLYKWKFPRQVLSKGDAKFVDIIHTNAGLFGIRSGSGDVDIWFNGGRFQPGCDPISCFLRRPISPSEQLFCSHYQAWRVYIQALMYPTSYLAVKCDSYGNYKRGKCDGHDKTYVGININLIASGNYYIKTGVTAVGV